MKPITICSQPICLYLHWWLIVFDSAVVCLAWCLPKNAVYCNIIYIPYQRLFKNKTSNGMSWYNVYIYIYISYSLQDVPLDHWVFLSGLFLVGWLLMVSGIQFKEKQVPRILWTSMNGGGWASRFILLDFDYFVTVCHVISCPRIIAAKFEVWHCQSMFCI